MSFKEYTIEQCCEILDNLRVPLNAEQRFDIQGEYPYYGANGVQGYISKYIFNDDLILIAEDGGNFEQFAHKPIAYRVSGKCWVNNHAHILKAKREFSQDFIFYSLEHKNILFFIAGGTRSKLTQSELRKIIIKHPNKKEADKIGEILKTVDETIAHTEALITKSKHIKTGLMQDLLTRGIDEHGNIRNEATHKFEVKNGIKVPIEWEVKELGEVYSGIKSGSTPSRKNNQYFEEGNFLWVKTLDLNEDSIYKTQEKITDKAIRETSCSLIPCDAVLIAMYGGWEQIGRTAILKKESTTNQAITALFNPKEFLLPQYTQFYLQYFRYKWKLFAISTRKDPNITKSDIKNFKISFPKDEKEQHRIVDTVESCKQGIKNLQNHLIKLQSLKTGLMQDLLSGKVRVQEKIKEEVILN